MVAGTYTKGSGSRSKPYQLKYAPSHAERPHGRHSREKGRGWQRSKSTVHDYGSDLYFGEDQALQRYGRRAQSSTSERGTYMNSNSDYFECPAQKPPKRRASVEAHVRAARPSSEKAGAKMPGGPPMQKRIMTVRPDSARECVTPNKALSGWVQANKDKSFQKVNIESKEGPPARPYTPKYDPNDPKTVNFPVEDPADEQQYQYGQRRMDKLIKTGSFKERAQAYTDKGEIPPDDGEPYLNTTQIPIDPESKAGKYVNEIRLELETDEVPANRLVKGRIAFDLIEPVTVDSVELDINKTFVMVDSNGTVMIPQRGSNNNSKKLRLLPTRTPKPYIRDLATPEEIDAHEGRTPPPNDFVFLNTYRNKANLDLEHKTIPFTLYIPENQVPTFSYIGPNGAIVVNSYSVGVSVRVCDSTPKSDLKQLTVPALGKRNEVARGDHNDIEIVTPTKFFTNEEYLDYAVGWIDGNANTSEPSRVSAQIVQRVKCSAIGVDSAIIQELRSVRMTNQNTNSVLDQYNRYATNLPAKGNWSASAESRGNTIQFTTPSVATNGFTCDYFLEVKADSTTLRGPVVLCNQLVDHEIIRSDLSPTSKRNKFEHVR